VSNWVPHEAPQALAAGSRRGALPRLRPRALRLNAFFHLRPSYASFTRAAFFGPGARQGVAFGLLEVRSSGRQSHQLELKGAAVSGGFSGAVWTDLAIWQDSWDPYPGWGGRAGSLVPLGRRDSFELRLVPWGLGMSASSPTYLETRPSREGRLRGGDGDPLGGGGGAPEARRTVPGHDLGNQPVPVAVQDR